MDKANARQDFGRLNDATGSLVGVEALILKPGDALRTLSAAAADLAVVGLDAWLDFNAAAGNAGQALRLAVNLPGISVCKLCLAAPTGEDLAISPSTRIATAYPALLKTWLGQRGLYAEIIERDGGVEDTIRLGLADAIFDVVQTGESLKANGLEVKAIATKSNAVIVARKDMGERVAQGHRLLSRLQSSTAPALALAA